MRRALNLTESFVQLAKAEADGYHFQPTLFAMLVMDAFDQVAVIAHLKGIHLVHDLDEADEGMVSADQSLLTRALFNVLENAIKYSPSGTTVRLRHSSARGWLNAISAIRVQVSRPKICLSCSASIGALSPLRAARGWAWA